MLKIGIAGASGIRAGCFVRGIQSTGRAAITAVWGRNETKVRENTAAWGDNIAAYTDYDAFLEESGIDAVIISTPISTHAGMVVKALEGGIHVLSEVPAADSLEDCKSVVEAAKKTKASYSLAENVLYARETMIAGEMVKAGLFGEVYHFIGEYFQDCHPFFKEGAWRTAEMLSKNGLTYGTHSLSPMLLWMKGDRVAKVSCTGIGRHYPAADGPTACEDGCLMLCRTAGGRRIDIRQDNLSRRPYAMNYRLQGTKGAMENLNDFRGQKLDRIWLEDLYKEGGNRDAWMDFESVAKNFIPEIWRRLPPDFHVDIWFDTLDYLMMQNYVASLLDGETFLPGGVHEAMDLTLPGIISTDSINNGSVWLDVPDSRTW